MGGGGQQRSSGQKSCGHANIDYFGAPSWMPIFKLSQAVAFNRAVMNHSRDTKRPSWIRCVGNVCIAV